MSKRKRELEKLLPLDVAADCLGLSVEVLTSLIYSDRIKANITDRGEVLVPESEVKKAAATKEKFAKLVGVPITVSEAVKKYKVPYTTLIGWVHSPLELIAIIKPGYGMQLDEADVARCAAIYKMRGRSSRIFDKTGKRPYELMRPDLAEYRRNRAKQEQQVSA